MHAPLVRTEWYPEPPTWSFLCDVDKENRELSFKMIRSTLEQASDFGAEYVVVHFPVPATDASGESEEKLSSIAWRSADRLAELSENYRLPLHIEGVGPSPYLSLEFLASALGQYDVLRYCFDTGHSRLAALKQGFDPYDLAQGLEPYVGSLHLWNLRTREDYDTFRHIPVHPSQRTEEGWVDIPRVLQILGSRPRPVILESGHSYPPALGGHDYRDGVKWVKELLATYS